MDSTGGSAFIAAMGKSIVRHMYPLHIAQLQLAAYKAAYEDPDAYEKCDMCEVPHRKTDAVALCGRRHTPYDYEDCDSVLSCLRPWCRAEDVPKCETCNAIVCEWAPQGAEWIECSVCGCVKCTKCRETCVSCSKRVCKSHVPVDGKCAGCIAREAYDQEFGTMRYHVGGDERQAYTAERSRRYREALAAARIKKTK